MNAPFVPLSSQELQIRYGDFFKRRVKHGLDPAKIPAKLRGLIPYAELWGVSDDTDRDNLVQSAPAVAKRDLAAAIDAFDDDFDDWLAGPESQSPYSLSNEYLAFSNMRIARDSL